MKSQVVHHAEGCQSTDNSQVLWDEKTGITSCTECGVESVEEDTADQSMVEGNDGQPT